MPLTTTNAISGLRIALLELFSPLVTRLPRFEKFFYFRIGQEWTSPQLSWPYRRIRVKRCWRHRYLMAFDMSQELQRRAFYTGRYYEQEVPNLVWEILRPGDCFVDIGANVGHISLLAVRRIREHGKVIAFEPNPETRALLITNKVLNDLRTLTIREEALSDVDGEGVLHLNRSEAGQCTLRAVESGDGVRVRLARGDAVLSELEQSRPTIIKIDVEGFEAKVLAGLGTLLRAMDLALIVEVTESWLRELGSGWQRLHGEMASIGYSAFVIEAIRTLRHPNGVQLRPLSPGIQVPDQVNILFVRVPGVFQNRIDQLVMNS